MTAEATQILQMQETYHVGVTKDKKTLASKFYFNSLPDKFSPEDKILVPDLEIATGSTIRFVLDELISRGADPYNIRIVCILASGYGCKMLSERSSQPVLYTAMIDEQVDSR